MRRQGSKISIQHSLPLFEPHVTLIGGLTAEEKAKVQSLTDRLHPFEVSLSGIDDSPEYWKAVFLEAYGVGLHEANKAAQECFGKKVDFFPHLSLAYGDLEIFLRHKIADSLAIPDMTFTARSVQMLQTGPDMNEWQWERAFFLR